MKMTQIEKLFVNSSSHSRQVSRHIEKLLQKVDFKAGQKYLDLGCGNGAVAIYLARKYQLEVTGVDVDPDQIRLAKAQSHGLSQAHFLTLDGSQLPFEKAEFDLVSTNKVMHHIPNWQDAVREMIRVLKPGGYLIYSDFIYPGWMASAGQVIAKNYAGFPTREALDALLAKYHLSKLYRADSWLNYEVVCQKDK
jgi:ubiquinone/menaquinone biosynthesis C-methylase UbiE